MATKNEWQEYFELMNDRKPTIEETTAAQAAGEFEVEVVAEPVASAQPEVTEQPEVATQQAAPVQTTTEAPKKPAVDTAEIKQKLQGFWGWLMASIKNPHLGTGVGAPKWYGLITLGLNALGLALTVIAISYTVGTQTRAVSMMNYASSMGLTPSANSMLFRLFIYSLILGVLIYGGALIGVFVARRYVLQDTTFDFKRAGDTFGQATTPGVIAWVVAIVGGLLSSQFLFAVGIMIAVLILSFATTFVIVESPNGSKLNRYYAVLAALIVSSIIIFAIVSVGGRSIAVDLESYVGRMTPFS